MASRDRSFYFTVTPPTGNTPQKPLPSGNRDDENETCASFPPDSLTQSYCCGKYLDRPIIHMPSSVSRTLSSLTTQSSETHLAQQPQENAQQAMEVPIRGQKERLNEQSQPSELDTDFECFPAPEMQGREPTLTPENLEELNRTVSKYKPHFLVDRPSTSAQITLLAATGSMPFDHEGAAQCLPPTIGHSRLQYYRDVHCLPDTRWAIKEGSLVIGIDPSHVECPSRQSIPTADTHELKLGKAYVICRMYTDMWALCIEVSLDFPPPLDSWSPLGVTVGFLPLCAVTLPVNFASFLERCEARRNTPERVASGPSSGDRVSAPRRHASIWASSEMFNQQQHKKSLEIAAPRMVHEILDNFLCLQRHHGDFVAYDSNFRDIHGKIPRGSMRRGRWGLRMRKRPPIQFKLPRPIMMDSPGLRKNDHPSSFSDSKSARQLSLYPYPPLRKPEQSFLRRLIARVLH